MGPTSLSAAVLESQLAEERVGRKHERFYLSFVIIVLAICILIKFLDGGFLTAFMLFAFGILLLGALASHW